MRVSLDGKKGKNRYAIVDKEDYDRVSKYRWYYNNGYAVSDFGVRMHRFIMNPPHDMVVDHINHNRLDNRRSNLRICTQFENSQNRVCAETTYGNIYSNKNVTRWCARNRIKGKNIQSSWYDTVEEANSALCLMRQGIIPRD